ncbi:TonB-dependent receptor [Thalassotalea litorea]|uniref:TonB-dependent receptor n=1 Tax=Thalassotalea litorea TaxID=2020715 RepID=UPI003734F705
MKTFFIFLAMSQFSSAAYTFEQDIETIIVEGRQVNLSGSAVTASEGVVGQQEIHIRPLSRTGDVLELVPGMVVTQHSGSGKANQYFLRGFNLDHGTDFATFVDGMPVNLRSHGHGQGYTDLNFVIPETIGKLAYKKGAYYADIGDFSGAGGVHMTTASTLNHNVASLGLGENGYQRALLMNAVTGQRSNTMFAVEGHYYDGPWTDIDEDIEKFNVLLKHEQALQNGKLSFSLMAYQNQWNSADQIPTRAVTQGFIDDLGSIDDSVGGESSRYSLSASWITDQWRGSAYVISYDLNLWSNFTYFLDDETNGDQFEQVDQRHLYGGQLEYQFQFAVGQYPSSNRVGFEYRYDDIDEVGLYQTQARKRLGVTRSDEIEQFNTSAYWENSIHWMDDFRTVIGLRYDYLNFDVSDTAGINRFGIDLSANDGTASDDLLSLKASVIYDFTEGWEGYASAGQGFHSNDARGTTITIDPIDGTMADTVDPLVRSTDYELGIRGFIGDTINTSLALWRLDLDSELLFVGDAGNTEVARPSRRQGIEWVAYYYFTPFLSTDFEYAYTDASFQGSSTEGNQIPGAVKDVIQAGLNLHMDESWFGSLRFRYFGKRPLTEDGSEYSGKTASWNTRIGYDNNNWRVSVDVFNLFNSRDHDIDYFYESKLMAESIGVEDVHFHPIEPRTVRLAFEIKY